MHNIKLPLLYRISLYYDRFYNKCFGPWKMSHNYIYIDKSYDDLDYNCNLSFDNLHFYTYEFYKKISRARKTTPKVQTLKDKARNYYYLRNDSISNHK